MHNPLTRRKALTTVFAAIVIPAAAPQTGAAVMGGEPVPQGYGQCSQCACPAYSGSAQVCQNCGHNYAAHW